MMHADSTETVTKRAKCSPQYRIVCEPSVGMVADAAGLARATRQDQLAPVYW